MHQVSELLGIFFLDNGLSEILPCFSGVSGHSLTTSFRVVHRLSAANGSSGRSPSERKIRTWFPRRQPRSMRLAVSVRSADSVFVTVVVHFQVVGHFFTAFAVT